MTDKSKLARYILGAIAVAVGLAIAFYALAFMGFFMRVGVVSGTSRLIGYVFIASLALPPIMLGFHTILYRHLNDPVINDKALRSVAFVAFIGVATLIYAGVMSGSTPGIGSIVALSIVSGVSQMILRRAPGGIVEPTGLRS